MTTRTEGLTTWILKSFCPRVQNLFIDFRKHEPVLNFRQNSMRWEFMIQMTRFMVHQRTAEPHPDKDSSARLIHNDPSDRGSLILIRNIPKERINLCLNHSRTVVSRKPELSRRDFLKLWPFYEHRKSIPPVKFHYFFSVLRSLSLESWPCCPLYPDDRCYPHGEALNPLQGLQYFLYDYDQSLVELAAPFPVVYALLASELSVTLPALVRYEIKLYQKLIRGWNV